MPNFRRLSKLFLIGAAGYLLLVGSCAQILPKPQPATCREALYPLPNCQPEMDQAGYWINKYPQPDQELLPAAEIQRLNQSSIDRGLVTDVFSGDLWEYQCVEADWPLPANPEVKNTAGSNEEQGAIGGYTLYTYLKEETERIKRRPRYDEQDQEIPKQFFEKMDYNLNLNAIREDNPIQYGVIIRRSDIRYYPTEAVIKAKRGQWEFDILQSTSLQALQPVAILHSSRDGAWTFIVGKFCRGWIKSQNLLTGCGSDQIKAWMEQTPFVMMTAPRVEMTEADGTTAVAETFYMGTRLPLLRELPDDYEVGLPQRNGEGGFGFRPLLVSKTVGVHRGYLPYTPRNVLSTVFQLLNQPYSWGGRGEHRDCSQLVLDVYATMGFSLPRNSGVQALVGGKRLAFSRGNGLKKKQAALDRLDQPALLQFPGHVMLYIGKDRDNYYIIHDIWAYRELAMPGRDRSVIIGKVVVSDLSLGEGSTMGTLLGRITNINLLQP